MDVYFTMRSAPLGELRTQVAWIERLGATGVMIPDHLFVGAPDQARADARRGSDPLVLLAAIASLSDHLQVGTSVSNIGLLHPALVLRAFAQLAVLVGGERVLAGLGAGWNREEFEALGMRMPAFSQRMDRLEQTARLARDLFDHGVASLEGSEVIARDLPLAPLPETPPRLFLGGGSDRLLEIAGCYADVLDLNGTSRAGALRGRNLPLADQQRRLSTTVSGLEESVEHVQAAAHAAERPSNAVSMSVLINHVVFCSDSQRIREAQRISLAASVPAGSLDECPYVLLGEPERMRDKLAELHARLRLDAILLPNALAPQAAERLLGEVIPRT